MAVKDGEDADEESGGGERRAQLPENHDSQEEGREGDADLDARHGHADEAEEGPHGHHYREGHREEPDGGTAELRPPETDGDHGEDVVEPRPGVT
jgi:hypothetical protein